MVSIPELDPEHDPDLEEVDCNNKPVHWSIINSGISFDTLEMQVDLEENVEVHAIKGMTTCTNTLSKIQQICMRRL